MKPFKEVFADLLTKHNLAIVVFLVGIFILFGPVWIVIIAMTWALNELFK